MLHGVSTRAEAARDTIGGSAPWARLFACADWQVIAKASLPAIGFMGMVALVRTYDAPAALALVVLLLGVFALLLWPAAATVLTVFLLYINFPGILTQQHGVPNALAGGFILLLGIPLAHLLLVRRERIRVDATFALMLGFLVVLLLSSFGALDPGRATELVAGYALEGLLLYLLILNIVRDRRTLRQVIWTLLAAGAMLSALSLYQDVTGSYQQSFGGLAARKQAEISVDGDGEPMVVRRGSERARGPVDEHNRFAQILIVLLPLAALRQRIEQGRRARFLAVTAGLLILGGIAVSSSRGAFVTVLLLAIAMASLRWMRPIHLIAGIGLLAAAVPVVSPRFIPRVLSIVDAKHLLADDPSELRQADGAIRGRTTSMLASLHVFRDHPLLGVGPGQFRLYFGEYAQNPDIKFRDRGATAQRRAHTLYGEIAAETGILGLTVFLAIVGLLIRNLWRERLRWREADPAASDLATALCLSLAGYLGTALFLHLSYQRYYWLLIGLAGATLIILRAQSEPRSSPSATTQPFPV